MNIQFTLFSWSEVCIFHFFSFLIRYVFPLSFFSARLSHYVRKTLFKKIKYSSSSWFYSSRITRTYSREDSDGRNASKTYSRDQMTENVIRCCESRALQAFDARWKNGKTTVGVFNVIFLSDFSLVPDVPLIIHPYSLYVVRTYDVP